MFEKKIRKEKITQNNQCYIDLLIKNSMLKVIFKVERLVLRCKNIQCEIIARKDSHVIKLSPLIPLLTGETLFEQETEFLIIQNDPSFLIQICLVAETYRKLGGEVGVNLVDWDQGVPYSTVSGLNKSPDRNSLISYTFLYIKKNILSPQKSFILCSEYRNHNLASMEIEKNQLTKSNKKLQAQVKTLKSKQESLKINEKIRNQEIINKKKEHQQKIRSYQQQIDQNEIKNQTLRKNNEEMIKMIQMYGKEETMNELKERYPEIINFNNDENKSSKRKAHELVMEDLSIKEGVSQGKIGRIRGLDRSRSREKQKIHSK